IRRTARRFTCHIRHNNSGGLSNLEQRRRCTGRNRTDTCGRRSGARICATRRVQQQNPQTQHTAPFLHFITSSCCLAKRTVLLAHKHEQPLYTELKILGDIEEMMDQRIVEFIAALRAAGVRVSLAESADAFRATETIGVLERDVFKAALSTTLIKEEPDQEVFEKLFPYYFGSGGPPLLNPQEDLSPADAQMLKDALRALLGDNERLQQLLKYIMEGHNPSQEELDEMGRRAGVPLSRQDYQRQWLARRMMRQLGMDQEFQELIRELLERLREMGMSDQALRELAARIRANEGILQEQIENYVGMQIARQQAEENPREAFDAPDLMHRKFQNLTEADIQELRHQVRRLAARLRSRAALRMKKGKRGTLDAKKTIRLNQRNGGVPIELKHKIHHQKPKLVLLCDVS